MPDVQVGSILEYCYTLDLRGYLFASHWILNDELFTKNAQFSLRPLWSSNVPMSLRWTLKNVPLGAQPIEDAYHNFRMEISNVPAFEREDFMPPENELKARVDFTYQARFGESDPDKFWKDVGKKRNAALEKFIDKRRAMDDALKQIVSPEDSPEARLRKIYTRVQGLRNTSYEVQRTEKEERRNKQKFAQNVEDIWKHGYGTAVELPWLFLGLARAAGFEAYGCWVAQRNEYFFNSRLMEDNGLAANVVLVKLNGKDIYLDPGTPYTPFGMLPWPETGTAGLRLDNEGGGWIRTALPSSVESQTRSTAKLRLSQTGDLEGNATLTFTGLDAMYQRRAVRNEDETARKKSLEEVLRARIPVSADVELTNKPEWVNPEMPLTAEFSLKIPNWASRAGRRMVVPVGVFAGDERHMFEHARRVHPIYFAYPYGKVDDVTIALPADWRVMSVPDSLTRAGDKVHYALNTKSDPKILHVRRELDVDIFLLEQRDYPGLRGFFQGVRSGDDQQIVLEPAAESPSAQ